MLCGNFRRGTAHRFVELGALRLVGDIVGDAVQKTLGLFLKCVQLLFDPVEKLRLCAVGAGGKGRAVNIGFAAGIDVPVPQKPFGLFAVKDDVALFHAGEFRSVSPGERPAPGTTVDVDFRRFLPDERGFRAACAPASAGVCRAGNLCGAVDIAAAANLHCFLKNSMPGIETSVVQIG